MSNNQTLSAIIAGEVTKALRSGVPLENVIAILNNQSEVLKIALSVITDIRASERSPA